MAFLDDTGVTSLVTKLKTNIEELIPKPMTGATCDQDGTGGTIPAPSATGGNSSNESRYRKYLCSDGKWRGFRIARTAVTSTTTEDVKAYVNIESGSDSTANISEWYMVRKKLWENASPTSSFGAQTITLSDAVDSFHFWIIEFYLSTSVQNKIVSFVAVGKHGIRAHFAGSGSNSNRGNSRDVEVDSTGKQLTFGANYYNNTSTNANMIPYKVFGFNL